MQYPTRNTQHAKQAINGQLFIPYCVSSVARSTRKKGAW